MMILLLSEMKIQGCTVIFLLMGAKATPYLTLPYFTLPYFTLHSTKTIRQRRRVLVLHACVII